MKFSGEKLLLNLEIAEGGSARIAILDQSGKPVPGFDLTDCDAISGDHVAQPVSWRGTSHLTRSRDKPASVHIELSRGSLFSLRFGS